MSLNNLSNLWLCIRRSAVMRSGSKLARIDWLTEANFDEHMKSGLFVNIRNDVLLEQSPLGFSSEKGY